MSENTTFLVDLTYECRSSLEIPSELLDKIQECWVKWDTLYVQVEGEYEPREFSLDVDVDTKRPSRLLVQTEDGEIIQED